MKGFALVLVAVVVMVGMTLSGPTKADAFVYACNPVAVPNIIWGGFAVGTLLVYNGSVSTANVTTKWLNKDGTNLVGLSAPCGSCGGGSAGTYPGTSGATTIPILAGKTLAANWNLADGGDLSGNVAISIRVVSDQLVVVGWAMKKREQRLLHAV